MEYIKIKGVSKGVIVFIHGNSSSSRVFMDILNDERILQTKIAVDLPGHGKSANAYVNKEDFFMASYKEKVKEIIEDTNDDDILVVGNSLGGHIAIELAPEIKNLKGILIFGTPPLKLPLNFEEAYLPTPALHTFFKENPPQDEIENSVKVAVFSQHSVPKIVEDFNTSNPKVRTALGIDIAEGRLLNEFEIFINLKVPKYIILGSDDPSINPEYIKQVKNVSKGICRIIHFENCGHYPSHEYPENFSKALREITNEVFR